MLKTDNTKRSELELGINFIAKGLQILGNEELKTKDRAAGFRYVEDGAKILNTQSDILYRNLKKKKKCDLSNYTYFPTSIREVLDICESPLSDWFFDFPIIEEYLPDFEYNETQLIDKTLKNQTEGAEKFLSGKSEYDIYEAFYEQKVFKNIREACLDDEDYCASRAYLPITIKELSTAHEQIKTKSSSLSNLILFSYYENFNSKKYKYVKNEQGYALCKCGYPLAYNELNEIECSHQKCRQVHRMKCEKTVTHSYIDRIDFIIKPQFHRFLTLPAIEEVVLFNKLKAYEDAGIINNLKLYPYMDAADICFEYEDVLYLIDLKEWVNPLDLLKDIKSKKGLLSNQFNRDLDRLNGKCKVFLIIPDYLCKEVRGSSKYIQRLKEINNGKTKSDKEYINILTVSKFISKCLPKIKKVKGKKEECAKATQISWIQK